MKHVDEQKMSFKELNEQMQKPTPIWKFEYLEDWVRTLTRVVAVYVVLATVTAIAFIVRAM